MGLPTTERKRYLTKSHYIAVKENLSLIAVVLACKLGHGTTLITTFVSALTEIKTAD